MPADTRPMPPVSLSHVEMYVLDAIGQAAYFSQAYGFRPAATRGSLAPGSDHFSIALRQGSIVLVLTEPRAVTHPGHAFLAAHGDGIADIALRVPDARAACRESVRRGARIWSHPGHDTHADESVVAFGDVRHTFVQDTGATSGAVSIPGFEPIEPDPNPSAPGLREIDHFAVCLNAGDLEPTVAFYEEVLGFSLVFEEKISVGAQAMLSKVVQDASRTVTLTLIEPDITAVPGQIDSFLANNQGAGIQHVAFSSENVVNSVASLGARGVEFLDTPDAYYTAVCSRLALSAHRVETLQELNILVDEDHDGQLFQIFTRSVHPRRTLFFEVIERLGARTFGSGNIKALYEAVEAQRQQELIPS